jgi:hypothetical protein
MIRSEGIRVGGASSAALVGRARFGALAARRSRLQLMASVQMFFIGCLLAFYVLARAQLNPVSNSLTRAARGHVVAAISVFSDENTVLPLADLRAPSKPLQPSVGS